jgi:hypothetical protein
MDRSRSKAIQRNTQRLWSMKMKGSTNRWTNLSTRSSTGASSTLNVSVRLIVRMSFPTWMIWSQKTLPYPWPQCIPSVWVASLPWKMMSKSEKSQRLWSERKSTRAVRVPWLRIAKRPLSSLMRILSVGPHAANLLKRSPPLDRHWSRMWLLLLSSLRKPRKSYHLIRGRWSRLSINIFLKKTRMMRTVLQLSSIRFRVIKNLSSKKQSRHARARSVTK